MADPTALAVTQGETAEYALTITASPGFSDPMNLSLQDAPTASINFSPNPVIPPGESLLSIETTLATDPGIYHMEVLAESGNITATTMIDLVVTSQQPTSYTLSISPTLLSVMPGYAAQYTINVQSTDPSPDPVTLSVLGLPDAIVTDWSTNPVVPGNEVLLTCTTSHDQSLGRYPFIITGLNGGSPVTIDAVLIIEYPYKTFTPCIMRSNQDDFFFHQ
jgi:uncharacterized membrane protein